MLNCFTSDNKNLIPIFLVKQKDYQHWFDKQTPATQAWLTATQFKNEAGNVRLLPDPSGKLASVLCCVADTNNFWCAGHLAQTLPEGNYQFASAEDETNYAVAWGLGAYQFERYKKPKRQAAKLFLSKEEKQTESIVNSLYLVRDLINTPTEDMGPTQLAEIAAQLAKEHQGTFTQIVGDDLLKQNYASIHTVGRASDDAPRLLDIRWGSPNHPKVTLVGKGVCFDSGGLDLKNSSGMLLMKKDMAGGAHVLGLARMIMQAKLPVCLRVLIPAVENVISGNAYRPGDIIKSRKGLTVEISNTDAEGRVVLADALAEAVTEKPELLIDISTLTGAARIALGTELPAVFSNNDQVVNTLIEHGLQQRDPIWRMPLFDLYRESLNSPIADLNNCSTESYGGAITAALFLKEFVPDDVPWLHFDLMAWNLRTRPGRPQGGEAMALRALFSYLQERYSTN